MKTYFFERTFHFKLKGLSVLLPLVMLVFLSFTPIRLNEYIDDEFYSIEIRIYTNDELFTEINYPCNCVVMGTLDVSSCINSSIICFNEGKLILY